MFLNLLLVTDCSGRSCRLFQLHHRVPSRCLRRQGRLISPARLSASSGDAGINCSFSRMRQTEGRPFIMRSPIDPDIGGVTISVALYRPFSSEVEGGCPVKSISTAALAALFALAIVSFACGSGNRLVSIAVSPNPVNLSAPQTLQLQAIGRYSDGTTKVLTSVSWTLSSPSPAVTVDSKGMANCQVSGGPAATAGTVAASFAGVSGSALISCSGPGV